MRAILITVILSAGLITHSWNQPDTLTVWYLKFEPKPVVIIAKEEPVATTTPLSTPSVQEKIMEEAENYGELTKEIALKIADAESDFVEKAKSPTSSAKGVYQFIDSTFASHCEGDALKADDNIPCAVKLIGEGKYNHWNASKDVWYPQLSEEAKDMLK